MNGLETSVLPPPKRIRRNSGLNSLCVWVRVVCWHSSIAASSSSYFGKRSATNSFFYFYSQCWRCWCRWRPQPMWFDMFERRSGIKMQLNVNRPTSLSLLFVFCFVRCFVVHFVNTCATGMHRAIERREIGINTNSFTRSIDWWTSKTRFRKSLHRALSILPFHPIEISLSDSMMGWPQQSSPQKWMMSNVLAFEQKLPSAWWWAICAQS